LCAGQSGRKSWDPNAPYKVRKARIGSQRIPPLGCLQQDQQAIPFFIALFEALQRLIDFTEPRMMP
jgi:hypothetical protein